MHAQLHIASSIENSTLEDSVKIQSVDVLHQITDTFVIADARLLVKDAFLRPVENPERVFILQFQSITLEAQNALLKLFEEPPANVRFHIIIPHESLLIPTLRSRLIMVESEHLEQVNTLALDFLKMSYKERLTAIAEKCKEKDTNWMCALVRELDSVLHTQALVVDPSVFTVLANTERYILIRGAARKMLLENLALSLPEISV